MYCIPVELFLGEFVMRKYLLALVALATIGHATSNASVDYKYVADYSTYYGDIGTQVTVDRKSVV